MSEREKEMSPECSYYEHSPHFTPFKYSLPRASPQLALGCGNPPICKGAACWQGR